MYIQITGEQEIKDDIVDSKFSIVSSKFTGTVLSLEFIKPTNKVTIDAITGTPNFDEFALELIAARKWINYVSAKSSPSMTVSTFKNNFERSGVDAFTSHIGAVKAMDASYDKTTCKITLASPRLIVSWGDFIKWINFLEVSAGNIKS